MLDRQADIGHSRRWHKSFVEQSNAHQPRLTAQAKSHFETSRTNIGKHAYRWQRLIEKTHDQATPRFDKLGVDARRIDFTQLATGTRMCLEPIEKVQ